MNTATLPDIEIGGRRLGAGQRPWVVAEMSANHHGSLDEALRIVRAAAAHGADAIKLQTYTPGTLTLDSERAEFFIDDPASAWHGRRLWDLYQEAHTPWEWHAPLFEAARAAGLACISSAFDTSSLEFLVSLGVDAIKIASFELVHLPLIEAAARTGTPLLLATGMASMEEIDEAWRAIGTRHSARSVLLKCTSAYPASEDDANVLALPQLRQRYGCHVGLSDHTLRPFAAYAATAHGAVLIEKHLTLSRAQGGVDAAFSIEPQELRELAEGAALVWRSLGRAQYGPQAAESTSLRERPSVYVVRPMLKGERFTADNLRIVRPGNGLAPRHWHALLGARCSRDIAGAAPLSWELVDGGEPDHAAVGQHRHAAGTRA